jgi:hypothetical protein
MEKREGTGMLTHTSRYSRYLGILMVVLYVISLVAFSYANWSVDPERFLWVYAINALLLSIPLVLFYGSIYILINAWREHRLTGTINLRLAKLIHWAPRVAAIMIIFFVSLFSLDVFEVEATLAELLLAFLIHNVPSIFLIIVLVFAWRQPVVGFLAFLLSGLFFLRFVVLGFSLGHFLLFSGPLLVISALFYADWRWLAPRPTVNNM